MIQSMFATASRRLTGKTLLDAIEVLDLVGELFGIIDQVGPLGQLVLGLLDLLDGVDDRVELCQVRQEGEGEVAV